MDGLKARLSFDAVAYDYDDEYLTIDTDTHIITINNLSRLFGVQYDGNSKLIKFRIRNKLSDIQKMQDSIVYINWIDSKGVKGQSIAINKTINNDTCEFAWKVPFDALKNSGVLHFAMSAVITENGSSVINQKWSTQIASVITPDGIYIKSYTPSSEEEDRIAQIYNELSKMINTQSENLQSQVNSLNDALDDKLEKLPLYERQELAVVKGAIVNSQNATQYLTELGEYVKYTVTPKDKYKILGWHYNDVYCGLFYIKNGVTTRLTNKPGAFEVEITIPEDIHEIYVNGRNNNPVIIEKIVFQSSHDFWNEYKQIKTKIKTINNTYGVNHLLNGNINVYINNYDESHDLAIRFKRKTGNNLPDFYSWDVCKNISSNVLVDDDEVEKRSISQGDTDYLSPSVVYAINNVDGDYPDFTSGKLTGGWHMYDSKTSGDYTATARNISFKVYCDGKEVVAGEKIRGDDVIVDIVNRLQGSNTEKADGSGREIIEQHFRISFRKGNEVVVDGEITALEDILYANYYGISYYFYGKQKTLPCYLVGDEITREGVTPTIDLHRSDNNCNAIISITDTDVFEMNIDTSIDLGKFNHNSGFNIQFSSGKAYPILILKKEKNNYLKLPKGGKAFFRGKYKCYPTVK